MTNKAWFLLIQATCVLVM